VERLVGAEEEEEEEAREDFSQGGWLWTNDAAARTKAKLRSQKVKPKKSLGQNFVTDDDVLRRVVRAANIQPGDEVLEIGPGTGNLTRHLLAAGATITAVEKDDRLVDHLQEEFKQSSGFRLIHGDILRCDIDEVLARARGGAEGSKLKVVANLPYYITTDVLKMLLPRGNSFSNFTVMLQEEVAQRFAVHQPGDRDYRYMSVFCHYYSKPEYKFRISRHSYFPAPKVDGAVVDFILTPPSERALEVSEERKFLSLVHASFQHRRKMMKNSLPMAADLAGEALSVAGLSSSSRAQDLTVDDFLRVYETLKSVKLDPAAEEP